MTMPDTVKNLVERFEQHRDAYRSGKYDETQLHREFLDPFLEALGWDIFNKQNYADNERHDLMVQMVERMLELHRQLSIVQTPREKEHIQRNIDFIDQQIDSLVYELCGLTQDEIKIVEG